MEGSRSKARERPAPGLALQNMSLESHVHADMLALAWHLR